MKLSAICEMDIASASNTAMAQTSRAMAGGNPDAQDAVNKELELEKEYAEKERARREALLPKLRQAQQGATGLQQNIKQAGVRLNKDVNQATNNATDMGQALLDIEKIL